MLFKKTKETIKTLQEQKNTLQEQLSKLTDENTKLKNSEEKLNSIITTLKYDKYFNLSPKNKQLDKECQQILNKLVDENKQATSTSSLASFSDYDVVASNNDGGYSYESLRTHCPIDIMYNVISGSHEILNKDVNYIMNFFNQKRQFPLNVYSIFLLKFFQQNNIIQNLLNAISLNISSGIKISTVNEKVDYNYYFLKIKKHLPEIINIAELVGGVYVAWNKEEEEYKIFTREEISLDAGQNYKNKRGALLSKQLNNFLSLSRDKKEKFLGEHKLFLYTHDNYYGSGSQTYEQYNVLDVVFVKGSNPFYYRQMESVVNGFGASIFEGCLEHAISLIDMSKFANLLARINGKFNMTKPSTNNKDMNDFYLDRALDLMKQSEDDILYHQNTDAITATHAGLNLEFINNSAYRDGLDSQMYNAISNIFGIPELFNADDSGQFKLFFKQKKTISNLIKTLCENKFNHYYTYLKNIFDIQLSHSGCVIDDKSISYSMIFTNSISIENIKQLLSYNAVANSEDKQLLNNMMSQMM